MKMCIPNAKQKMRLVFILFYIIYESEFELENQYQRLIRQAS
jgi:hypothetical protein